MKVGHPFSGNILLVIAVLSALPSIPREPRLGTLSEIPILGGGYTTRGIVVPLGSRCVDEEECAVLTIDFSILGSGEGERIAAIDMLLSRHLEEEKRLLAG